MDQRTRELYAYCGINCPPLNPTYHQTWSVLQSILQSASHHLSSNKCSLEKELVESQKQVKELKYRNDVLETCCHFMGWVAAWQQKQLHAKATRKGTWSKKMVAEARVLTSKEGCLELEQIHEGVCLKKQQQDEGMSEEQMVHVYFPGC